MRASESERGGKSIRKGESTRKGRQHKSAPRAGLWNDDTSAGQMAYAHGTSSPGSLYDGKIIEKTSRQT